MVGVFPGGKGEWQHRACIAHPEYQQPSSHHTIPYQATKHTHCPKSNPHFRDITRNAEENEMLRQIFRVVSLFPSCISCYISDNRLSSGQCTAWGVVQPWTSNTLFSHKYFFFRHRRDNVFCFCTCVTIFGFTDTMDANSVSNFFKAGSRASKPTLADPIVFCDEYNFPSSVITIITKNVTNRYLKSRVIYLKLTFCFSLFELSFISFTIFTVPATDLAIGHIVF